MTALSVRAPTGFAIVALAAATAAAHAPSADDVIAAIAAPAGRVATGVGKVARDRANPRLLVVRVNRDWYAIASDLRVATARAWWTAWRRAEPAGVVSVLDAGTDRPVVRFGPGGVVGALASAP